MPAKRVQRCDICSEEIKSPESCPMGEIDISVCVNDAKRMPGRIDAFLNALRGGFCEKDPDSPNFGERLGPRKWRQ